jgi:hypothetical protein
LAKLVLNNDQLAEEFFADSQLIGMQCSVEPHRFIWLLNRHFGFDFRYQQGAELELKKKGRTFSFPVFQFQEPMQAMPHIIYTNQFDGEYLLPELKHTDFLWLVRCENEEENFVQPLVQEIRKIDLVQLVTVIANEKIRNKGNLIL